MTTNVDVFSTPDVFAPNEVFEFPAFQSGLKIGAHVWLCPDRSNETAHRQALSAIGTKISESLKTHRLWLLVGHTAPQPSSRVVRHRALWGSLKARGVDVPEGERVGEVLVESAAGLRFFGAIRLEGDLGRTTEILGEEPASYVAAVPNGQADLVDSIVRQGWVGDKPWPGMLAMRSIVGAHGIIVGPVGAFDDREVGVVAIGPPQLLSTLQRS